MRWLRAPLLALICCAPAAHADDGAADVVVRRKPPVTDATSDAPVTVITADDLARSGATTLDEALNKLPIFGAQGVNGAQNDGGYGAAFVELRNLNFNRTLVLVDGERFVLSGIRTDEAVDLNNLPLALIDRIEVLRDGSQPRYGADSVAGTVNIILKHRFDGAAVTAYQGVSGAGDGATETYEATAGHNYGRGNVVVDLGLTNRDPVRQSDRAWSRDPIAAAPRGGPAIIGSPAAPGGHAVTADGAVDALLLGGGRSRPYDAATDGYNDAGSRYLQGGLRRYALSALGAYDITDAITADAQALVTYRQSQTLLPPQTLGLAGTARYPSGFTVPAGNASNPFGRDVTLERVLTEAGDQLTQTSGPTARVVLGVQGGAFGDADWRVSVNHGESRLTYATSNAINLADVFATLPQTDYFGPGTLSRSDVDAIRYTDVSHSAYTEDVARATVHAPLWRLPGGPLDITVGAELRAEHGQTSVSGAALAGAQAGGDVAPTAGGYTTREAFVDLSLPLLKDAPGARVLSADAQARFTDTSRFGGFPTWSVGATYAPDATIRLRATAGAARRVPAITEAFGGVTANYLPLTDPCDAVSGGRANPVVDRNCRAGGLGPNFVQSANLVDVASGGNPALRPEASENVTIGAVLAPPSVPGLSVSADWYDYRIKDAIDSLADTDPNYIPDTCYASAALSSPLCALIQRAPAGANAGQINRVLALDGNIGTIKTSGVDVGLALTRPLAGGMLSADWQTTWLLDYRIRRTGEAGFIQYAGTFPALAAVGIYARARSTATIEYDWGAWSASWTGRLISGARVLGADPQSSFIKAGQVAYHDVGATWRGDRLKLTAAIENITGQAPPRLLDGATNTNTNTYDVIGRFFYVRCSADF